MSLTANKPPSTIAPILKSVLAIAQAALGATESEVVPLTGDALTLFNTVVLPKLDVPAFLVPVISGAESTFTAPLDSFATAELELLSARVASLL